MNYQVQPFVNHENLQELSEFFQKSIGPKGTYKFFTTSAGQTRVCKSSYGLVTSLISEMVDPCAETVLHLVKSHLGQNLDFGLILGSLTCDLILQSQETVDFSAILVPILQKSQFSLYYSTDRHETFSICHNLMYSVQIALWFRRKI